MSRKLPTETGMRWIRRLTCVHMRLRLCGDFVNILAEHCRRVCVCVCAGEPSKCVSVHLLFALKHAWPRTDKQTDGCTHILTDAGLRPTKKAQSQIHLDLHRDTVESLVLKMTSYSDALMCRALSR